MISNLGVWVLFVEYVMMMDILIWLMFYKG